MSKIIIIIIIRKFITRMCSQALSMNRRRGLVSYRPCLTRWLMPSVNYWMLIMCSGVLSWRLSSQLLQVNTMDHSGFFGVFTVNSFWLVDQMNHWMNILVTVSNGWVLHGSSLRVSSRTGQFLCTNISQCSVVTCLRMDGIFSYQFTMTSVYYNFAANSVGERI